MRNQHALLTWPLMRSQDLFNNMCQFYAQADVSQCEGPMSRRNGTVGPDSHTQLCMSQDMHNGLPVGGSQTVSAPPARLDCIPENPLLSQFRKIGFQRYHTGRLQKVAFTVSEQHFTPRHAVADDCVTTCHVR